MKCKKCNSENVKFESNGKQGFGAKKALAGLIFLGPLGLFAGAINKNKNNDAIAVCQDCGHIQSAALTAQEKLDKQRAANKKWKLDHPKLWKALKVFYGVSAVFCCLVFLLISLSGK